MSNYQPMTKKTDIYCIKFVFTVDIVKMNSKKVDIEIQQCAPSCYF